MDREEMLSYLNDDLVIKGTFYSHLNIPSQISNAIYTFGRNDAFDILAFIDLSDELDGSKGMIITPQQIYFKLSQTGVIKYAQISYLGIEQHHQDPTIRGVIKSGEVTYAFTNRLINAPALVTLLSKITGNEIEMIMSDHEKVAYYVPIVLNDIENEEYEDLALTVEQLNKIKELHQDLTIVDSLDQDNYQYELENICTRAMSLFDELELDSDEIDILEQVQTEFMKKDEQEEQKIDQAQQFYDDMMNKYQQGDTQVLDSVKNMMASMGIDENELAGKSPDEIQDFLCERFGISKSMFEKLAGRFKA